jgi:hypothetical protein
MVGPHAWSFIGTGFSNASCGDTICENCGVFISGTSITNSRAVSNSSGNVDAAPISARPSALVFDCDTRIAPQMIAACARHALTSCTGGSNGAFVSSYVDNVHNSLLITAVSQVYGGSVSFVVHPYVWSSSSFNGGSSSSAGSTIVSQLSAIFLDCNFFGSTVSTYVIGGPTSMSMLLFYCVVVLGLP